MLPKDRQIASYLFSAKANYLAHLGVGKRQQATLITLPLVSLVLRGLCKTRAITSERIPARNA